MKQVFKYCLFGLLSLLFSGIIGFHTQTNAELEYYAAEKKIPEKDMTTSQNLALIQHIPVNYSTEGVLAVDNDNHNSNFKSYARLLTYLENQKKTFLFDSSAKCYVYHPIPNDRVKYYVYALKKIVI